MRNLFTALFLIATFTVFSQSNTEQLFKNLHKGAILVRLTTNSNTLKALQGKDDVLAAKIVEQRDAKNREIIAAFSSQFTFCPVYYFYSDDSKAIAEKNFNNVLLDSDLNKVSELPVLKDNYLIAAFNITQVDTASYLMGSSLQQGEKGLEYRDQYGSRSMGTGVNALVLFSPELIALQSPYPHYARTFERLPFIERSKEKTVERMQYKIEKYLKDLK